MVCVCSKVAHVVSCLWWIVSTVADPQSHKHFHVSSVKVSACAKDCRVVTIADSIGSMVENVRANGVVVCV